MKTAVKWGVILGVAVCVWTLLLHVLGFYTTRIGAGLVADGVAVILPIIAIVLGLRERKRQGPLTFAQAVVTAVVIGVVSVPISAGFLWWYHHYMNPEWMDYIVAHQRAKMTAAGDSAAAIAAMEQQQRASATDAAQLTGAVVGSTVISLVIGIVAGAVMRSRQGNA